MTATRVAEPPRASRGRPSLAAAPATWIVARGQADHYWRAEAPAAAVGGKLIDVLEPDLERSFAWPNQRTAFPWTLNARTADGQVVRMPSRAAYNRFFDAKTKHIQAWAEFPAVEGTAVWTRPDQPRAILGMAMRDQGIRVIAECDDNYFAPANQNLFLRHGQWGEKQRMEHARAMWSMDACVFSTAWLRDTYRKEFRSRFGKKNMPELHVCRNNIPHADWPERDEGEGRLRIGFMGSPSHVWDVQLAYPAFHAAKAHGYETVMIGYNPGDTDPHLPEAIKANEAQWRSERSFDYQKKWGKVIERHIPWVDPGEYHRAALPLDIGLAPLRSDSFCLAKSDVKSVEYAISGAVSVLQNNPVYNSAGWRHGVNCLMAHDAESMMNAVLRLAREPKLRYELVSAAQEMVWNERNEDTLKQEWGDALASP